MANFDRQSVEDIKRIYLFSTVKYRRFPLQIYRVTRKTNDSTAPVFIKKNYPGKKYAHTHTQRKKPGKRCDSLYLSSSRRIIGDIFAESIKKE